MATFGFSTDLEVKRTRTPRPADTKPASAQLTDDEPADSRQPATQPQPPAVIVVQPVYVPVPVYVQPPVVFYYQPTYYYQPFPRGW